MASPASYEEEQERLRRESEGDNNLRIEVPKEPEVDPDVYKDVDSMVFRGFLVAHADIDGVRFTFKSLNQHEFSMLRFITGDSNSTRFWDSFLAWGVFIANGVNVLAHRERYLPDIESTFASIPRTARERIIRHLSDLNRRASAAVQLTEAYAMESYSRYRWIQLRGLDLTRTSVSGIPGTERLGMNWAQLVWRAINFYEDTREQSDREWENAKFVGACMAGKGIQKVYNRDDERRRQDREDRATRKDAILRHVLLGEETQGGQQKYGVPLIAARTDEELIAQLEKSLRGEKDFHDFVVEEHEKHNRALAAGQKEALKELVERNEEAFGGRMLRGSTDLQGLSPQDVRDRLEKRKTVQAQKDAQRMVYPDLLDEKGAEFARKWGMGGDEEGSNADAPVMPADQPLPPRTSKFRR